MNPHEHIQKAERLETTLQKLDLEEDYEMVIDNCMNAVTHYMNAAFHAEGMTHEMQDQGHTSRPPLRFLSASLSGDLKKAMGPVEFIESLRPQFVRGTEPCDRETIEKCVACFEEAKRGFLEIIGDAGKPPLWEAP